MSTTRMGINPLETISHEDGPSPEPDGGHRQLLPWGSVPFSGISAGDRSTALPQLYRPLSGFLTVSAVFSHPNLVALFHATSAPRILVFRAFPSSSAAISLDIRCSLVVSPASWNCGCPSFHFAPAVRHPPLPSSVGNSAEILSRTSVLRQTSSLPTMQLSLNGQVWRAACAIQRVVARHSPSVRLTPEG